MRKKVSLLLDDVQLWMLGWYAYIFRRLRRFGRWFETNKNTVVDVLIARRGEYQRPFLHISVIFLVIVGLLSAPILAHTYPGGVTSALAQFTPPSAVVSSLDFSEYGIQTQVSEKPRDQIISYKVQSGETLSSIAQKFGVSIDSIKWANDIKGDSLSVGLELKIPPVTGMVVKVKEGETIYSIAKKYKTEPQKIVNFPFNDFSDLDTFALAVGQILVVPDGVMPEAPAIIPQYANGQIPPPPPFVSGKGQFLWPTVGVITQCPIWYHMAFDVANPSNPPVIAADDGTVVLVEYLTYGYGRHAIVSHQSGLSTLYGHMIEIYVKPGDHVSRGQVIGKMGSTGRSTGTHLHFEIRRGSVLLNPTSFFSTRCGG
jgi:murein DD-endopeptidase MepM/ murein hydrolase activator NlpD